MTEQLLVDGRWAAGGSREVLGIRRLAREILTRLPPFESLPARLPLLHPLEPLWLAAEVERRRPSVYFTPGFNPPLAGRVPLVFTVCDLIHVRFPAESGPLQRAYYRTVVRPAARRARSVLTLSEHSKSDIVAWAGVDEERVVVVGCGVSADYSPDGKRHEPGYPYVLNVGNRKPHKNLPRLLDAFARSGLDEHRLVLTGEPHPELLRHAAALCIEQRLVFAGRLSDDELPAVYRGAACLAIPSLHEGFGLPALEAMACGVPVVAAAATSLPEVVGDAGVLVDPKDPEAIAGGLVRAVTDTSLRERGLARAARFSWDDVAERVRAALGV